MSDLQAVTLGFAGAEVDHKIREVGGNNRGPRVEQYLANAGIHTAAPWCAAFVQFCSDRAASLLSVKNPLDDVKLEAYVQSYYDWAADKPGRIVGSPRAGDLILFDFHGARWDHIGFVAQPPTPEGIAWSVEGNTGDVDQRDGDGVYLKPRDTKALRVCFVRWAP